MLPPQDWRLDVVSRVGLAVSVLCLTLAVLTFLLCRSLRGSRTTIHLHLSLSLLVAHSLFLLGIEHTHSKVWGGRVPGGQGGTGGGRKVLEGRYRGKKGSRGAGT